jgi:parallel beta-helix repeat protein
LSNAQLTVKSGATLIIEQNADLAMQSGSKILVENGGVVKVQQNATLTIPSGGTLQASAGAQFKFSPWSGLLSYGQVNVYGTQSLTVTFQSIFGSGGTWNGITLSGSGANGSNFQYATVANVLTYWGSAVNILDASYVHVEHCTISSNASNGTNGLLLYNASDAMIGYNTINGNAGDGIRFVETGWANVYKNIIQGNANAGVNCINSSLALGTNPFYSPDGNNVITGGNYGVIASWYSYP